MCFRISELQVCYDGFVADGFLAKPDIDLGAQWQINVHAATEFYESHVLIDVAFFAFFQISYYAPRHCSGNLAYQNVCAFGGGYDNGAPLVFGAGLGEPCCFEASIVVNNLAYYALDGNPVGVYVEKAHKDADHQAAVVEVFVFVNFLDNNDLTICRGNHNALCVITDKATYGALEEIEDYQIDYDADAKYNVATRGA